MRRSLISGVVAAVTAGVAGLVACSAKTVPMGGIVLVLNTADGDWTSKPQKLDVRVTSVDGGMTYGDAGTSAAGVVAFPQTLTIESSGNPNASIGIDISLWAGGKPVDVRRYEVLDIPDDRFVELDVWLSAACTAQAGDDDGEAISRCPSGETCCAASEICASAGAVRVGQCVSDVIRASALPPYGDDAGRPVETDVGAGRDAADATIGDGSDVQAGDASRSGSEGADAEGDAAVEPEEASVCQTACVPGSTHCVEGTCAPVPPSCAGGGIGTAFNCGGSNGSSDCCASYRTPLSLPNDASAGSFYRDYNLPPVPNLGAPATVTRFRLDAFEVTVGRFRKFVSAVAGGDAAAPWVPADHSGRHAYLNGGAGLAQGGDMTSDAAANYESGWNASWDSYLPASQADWDAQLIACTDGPDAAIPPPNTWTPSAGPGDDLPINCVSWYAAYAFCIWDGGFLPSSTEWDYAASGGTQHNVYAWGNDPPLSNAKLAIWNCWYGTASAEIDGINPCVGLANIAPVGSAPEGHGLWNQLDLTGSVFEWTLDFWTGDYPDPCVDCAATSTGTERIARGGSYASMESEIVNDFGYRGAPEMAHDNVGVRCARTP